MSAPTPFDAVRDVLAARMPTIDHSVAEATLATMLANQRPGPPVWLMLVAPPSSGKTALLSPLAGIYDAQIISKLTPYTLLSGHKPDDGSDPSLLTRLGPRPCMIVKELGTLLEDAKTRTEVLSQFREVFDGNMSKEFGTGTRREWSGKATMIVGMTQAIDRYQFDELLGARFLKLRFNPTVDPEALALATWDHVGTEAHTSRELHDAYLTALNGGESNISKVALSRDTAVRLAALSSFLAAARSAVSRNQYRQDRIELVPDAEATPRLLGTLKSLGTALAALRGETDLRDDSLLRRIALDTLPLPRRDVLVRAITTMEGGADAFGIRDLVGRYSESYLRQIVDDLIACGVFEPAGRHATGSAGRPAEAYVIASKVRGWIERAGLVNVALL